MEDDGDTKLPEERSLSFNPCPARKRLLAEVVYAAMPMVGVGSRALYFLPSKVQIREHY
jgi:hypothetical protein